MFITDVGLDFGFCLSCLYNVHSLTEGLCYFFVNSKRWKTVKSLEPLNLSHFKQHISKVSLWTHQKIAMLWIEKEMQTPAFNTGFNIDLCYVYPWSVHCKCVLMQKLWQIFNLYSFSGYVTYFRSLAVCRFKFTESLRTV